MSRLTRVLVAVASVVVIAAGSLWLWQQAGLQAVAQQEAERAVAATSASRQLASECEGFILTLQQAANDPASVAQAQIDEATNGHLSCLEANAR